MNMRIEQIKEWISAVLNDDWTISHYHKNKSIEQACKLTNDTFDAVISQSSPTDSIFIWTKDGISATVPQIYNYTELINNIRKCQLCAKEP